MPSNLLDMDKSRDKMRQTQSPQLSRFPPMGVARSGYEWIEGQYRPSGDRPKLCLKVKDRFLRIRNTSLGMSAKSFAADVYTQFANLETTPKSTLEFANKHGSLGLRQWHYHGERNAKGYAERYTDWEGEISFFQQTFRLWKIVEGRNRRDLRQFAESSDPLGRFAWLLGAIAPDKSPFDRKVDLFEIAWRGLIGGVNNALHPDSTINFGPITCVDCGAPLVARQTPEITSHVSFGLAYRDAKDGPRAESKLTPDRLLSAIWLQFSEAIIGERKIKRCEAHDCRKWMDVTNSDRPAARRMHPQCAERVRKQRYRASRS